MSLGSLSHVKSRVARNWETATDTPSSPKFPVLFSPPENDTSQLGLGILQVVGIDYITPHLPRPRLMAIAWSQYVGTVYDTLHH